MAKPNESNQRGTQLNGLPKRNRTRKKALPVHTKTFLLPLIAIIVIPRKAPGGGGCCLNFEHSGGGSVADDIGG